MGIDDPDARNVQRQALAGMIWSKQFYYYGDDFKVECPTGAGQFMTICEVARELTRRLTRLFLKGADGQRIESIQDETWLRALLKSAIQAGSIEEFARTF